MSGKLISLEDYLEQKGRGECVQGSIVVGSNIMPDVAVEMAIVERNLSIANNEDASEISQKLRNDWLGFYQDPGARLIQQDCEKLLKFREEFTSETSKDEVLGGVENHLRSGQFRRVRDDLILLIDELYTNFTKCAPNNVDVMDISIESDAERIMVVCRDPFGGLDPYLMLKNMRNCFENGVKGSINWQEDGHKGASIGSFLMYSLSQGMIIANQDNERTMVCLWMPKLMHHEDRVVLAKDLNVFLLEGE